jgi:hypothetical protein
VTRGFLAFLLLSSSALSAAPPSEKEAAALLKTYCVACHALPAPDVLPRAAWKQSIEKMSYIFEGKPMPGWGQPPPVITLSDDYRKILAHYEAKAPAALPAPDPWPAPTTPARFARRRLGFPDALTPEPAVSNVALADLDGDGTPEILATDMRQGLVLQAKASATAVTPLSTAPNPAHVTAVDLDGDKRLDLLLADLGQFFPGDHEKGAVVFVRGTASGFAAPVRFDGFPRLADVEPGDFDGDGRLDLLVSAFGWRAKGNVTVMLNRTADWAQPAFDRVVLDARPGAVAASALDLDGDKRLDAVALVSQEHEEVVAYLGDGKGAFRAQSLYKAPHPNWGSTGLTVVDLDKDGDDDFLVTNGDMFDDDILKPYHAITWLENKGKLRFEPRTLARLAGVHKAVAADLDGDGDLDVAAAALTGAVRPEIASKLPSLVWLEQVKPGRFEKRTLEVGNPTHATLAAGDLDGDGDADVVTGTLAVIGKSETWLDVWENQAAKPR